MTRSAPVAALLTLVVVLTGCARAPEPPAPPPTASTPAAYQELLDRTDRELAGAFTAIARAPTLDVLDRTVLAAAGVASGAAERLANSAPPASVAAENTALATALRQFARELAFLSQQINLRAICAGPTAAAAIATAPGMPALRNASAALAAAPPDRPDRPPYRWGAALPPPDAADVRPPLPNGTLVADHRAPGQPGDGVLEVHNEATADAVVVMSTGQKPLASIAVTAGQVSRLDGIPDGDYDLFYTTGRAWNTDLATFSRDCTFHRFTGPTSLRTRATPAGIEYTVQTITLRDATDQPSEDTAEIPPTALPR